MSKEKDSSPEKKAALEAIRAQFVGTDGATQRAVLLEVLIPTEDWAKKIEIPVGN